MKHVKRILVSLLMGLLMVLAMGFVSDSETWLHDALYAGFLYALGFWLGAGFEFFHED